VSAPRDLVAEWRCDAVDDDCWDKDERAIFKRCADKLEAALATPPGAPTEATVWVDGETMDVLKCARDGVPLSTSDVYTIIALMDRCRVAPEVG
jgi:hypothetical protein